ncbi:MAG: aminotransferase class I/II-fold pyridoxal phosphate-dependent enzyme [Chloroflexi bacterium]|nr:aminotransferase class I/II-fold pyridoxal phosphate-dependent enzyme [Chloroflexota bacterium]
MSATLAMNLYVKQQKIQGNDITNFGLGESPFGAPPILRKALADNSHRTSYLPSAGLMEARRAVAKFYAKYFDYYFPAERVVIGPGSKELIFNSMLAMDCAWLFCSPSWVSYEAQAKLLNRPTWRSYIPYQDDYRITAANLRKRFVEIDDKLEGRPLALLINYPNNPTGLTISKDEVKRIVKFARNNEIIILSDEIYANVTHSSYGAKHYSIGVEYPEGTIVTGGTSKDRSLGGWRFGVAILPEDQPGMLKAFKAIGSETYSSVAEPIQRAACVAYDGGDEIDRHIKDSTGVHELVGSTVHNLLSSIGYKTPAPEGAFYLLPSLNHLRDELEENGIFNSSDLVRRIIHNHKVAVIPGSAFGLRKEDFAFRLAYIDYDGPQVLKNYRKDPDEARANKNQFVKENCPEIVKGIIRLNEFIETIT